MKNRRITLAAFLLIAVLVMGIGFAAVTDNLEINGEASANTTEATKDFDADVYFSAAEKVVGASASTGAEADTIAILADEVSQKDIIRFGVHSLAKKDETVTFKCVIQNDSEEFDAVISLDSGFPTGSVSKPSGAELSEYYDITYSIEQGVANTGNITAPAKDGETSGTATVYVTVTMKQSPRETINATFSVALTATAQPKA